MYVCMYACTHARVNVCSKYILYLYTHITHALVYLSLHAFLPYALRYVAYQSDACIPGLQGLRPGTLQILTESGRELFDWQRLKGFYQEART